MKKIFVLFSAFIIASCCMAADTYKVLAQSEKPKPAWIGLSGNGYICLMSSGSTMEEAQQTCLRNLKTAIIEAIATNIVSENKLYQENHSDNDVSTFVEEFVSNTSSKAATLPFITDISISKCTATYWEKLQDKATKKISFVYHIQYPFSEAERMRYLAQFETLDNSMVKQTEELEKEVSNIQSIEQLDRATIKIQECINYYFDSRRKAWAEGIAQLYQQAIKKISIHGKPGSSHDYTIWLELDGRKITPSGNPAMKSECANDFKFQRKGQDYYITYDTDGCLPDEQNFMEVTFRIKGKTIKEKFVIK